MEQNGQWKNNHTFKFITGNFHEFNLFNFYILLLEYLKKKKNCSL